MQEETQVTWVNTVKTFIRKYRSLENPPTSSAVPLDSSQHQTVIAQALHAQSRFYDSRDAVNLAEQNTIRAAMGVRALMLGPARHGDEGRTWWRRFTDLIPGEEHPEWEDAGFLQTLYGAVAISPLSLLYYNWRPGGFGAKNLSLAKLVQAMHSPYLGRGDHILHVVEGDCWRHMALVGLNGPWANRTAMPMLVDKWEKIVYAMTPQPQTAVISATSWDAEVRLMKASKKWYFGAADALRGEARKKKTKAVYGPCPKPLDSFLKEQALAAFRNPDPVPAIPLKEEMTLFQRNPSLSLPPTVLREIYAPQRNGKLPPPWTYHSSRQQPLRLSSRKESATRNPKSQGR
ncbi:hypothetical protein BD410DRAFT_847240 [Rickenella mellea]|uniref:Uncharacterized protein n=1 Tax=Rickenella mellea TaxID=50990 RepID=A0A4Y7PFC2_9AGAM|nr:hypothetical protein BD410DRAFT_847240 [Rickenella mellea]